MNLCVESDLDWMGIVSATPGYCPTLHWKSEKAPWLSKPVKLKFTFPDTVQYSGVSTLQEARL